MINIYSKNYNSTYSNINGNIKTNEAGTIYTKENNKEYFYILNKKNGLFERVNKDIFYLYQNQKNQKKQKKQKNQKIKF